MKSCVIFCALIAVSCSSKFPNPFAKKTETCPVPIIAENVTHQVTKKLTQICFENYAELGCFANDAPWHSFFRPFPIPASPKIIDAKIYLYTSKYPNERFTAKLWKDISISESDFDPQRPKTAFITHGFSSDGNESWINELKDALLKRIDANVFVVDWGKGAKHWNYLKVAANTRVVGAELKRFTKYLIEAWNLNPARIHFMGHSLGAHISAYAAKGIPGIGKITAFDPAQPGFEGCPAEVRLTKNDANFVDVIHTNISPTIPLFGFGLILPTGHVDYYMNGGAIQPGCITPPNLQDANLSSMEIAEIMSDDPVQIIPAVYNYIKLLSSWVSCSHGKSYQYYIEAVLNDDCIFWGRSTSYVGTGLDIATMGRMGTDWKNFDECTLHTCSPIGLNVEDYPARGSFSIFTTENSPYCKHNSDITEIMKELRQQKSLEGFNTEKKEDENGALEFMKNILKPYF